MSASTRNRAGIAAKQHADEILLLRDLTLELGHSGRGLLILRLGLLVIALGNSALLEAHALQSRRFAQALRGLLRNFELPVERAQLDVAGGDVGDDRQHDRALALLAGKQARARGLRSTPQPAPDIQFEARRETYSVGVERVPAGRCRAGAGAQAGPRRRGAGVDFRELRPSARSRIARRPDPRWRSQSGDPCCSRVPSVPDPTAPGPRTDPTRRCWRSRRRLRYR